MLGGKALLGIELVEVVRIRRQDESVRIRGSRQ
jgi:hypothetical protein